MKDNKRQLKLDAMARMAAAYRLGGSRLALDNLRQCLALGCDARDLAKIGGGRQTTIRALVEEVRHG
ncbi:hypothetical protein [Brevibacterium moorei]|uniref:hypothetical protein n=1 Tax=Brevibacterium moorei TaxID=2968457 RepID=UPI00211C9DD2|nr:hypothetical protein [Brevibacterium sp. 68QC2CO]MCQ9385136.1 hypothetical protein [Brevibacterium sp. 68QC2CO]